MKPTIAIIGASSNRHKFGNRAVRAYTQHGYEVYPINPHEATVEGHRAYRSILDVPVAQLDRVSLYVSPVVGMVLIEEIVRRQPREVWFNPGSDSPELLARARSLGLNVVAACSIVAIGSDPYPPD